MERFDLPAAVFGIGAMVAGLIGGPARAEENLSVLLDFAPWGMHAGVHLAAQKGWFDERDLNVDIRDGRGSVSTIQLVASGNADVGMAQLGPMATAREASGIDLKSIAGWVRRGDLAAVVDASSDIHSIADIKGKKLALFTASPFLPFLDMFLAGGGLTRDDVTLLYVEPSAMMTTYISGQADGVLTAGPYGQSLAQRDRPARLVLAEEAGITYPSYGYFSTEETIADKHEALSRFMDVQVRTFEYIYDGHIDEAVEAIISQRPGLKLNPEVLKAQLELNRDFLITPNTEDKGLGWQSPEDWKQAVESMVAAGLLGEGSNPQDFYTNEFVGD